MMPIHDGFLNKFQVVKIPKTRDLFSRFGNSTAVGVHVEDGTPFQEPRKNDLCDEVSRAADKAAAEAAASSSED